MKCWEGVGLEQLEQYWNDIPESREKAITYNELMEKWHLSHRAVRNVLHQLSVWDSGTDYILIRSSKGKGFYKTKDKAEINKYKWECINRARHTFELVKQIRRVLGTLEEQMTIDDFLKE